MGKLILFVEEDAQFRVVFAHAIREALADEGLEVAFVESGTLAEARARPPRRADRREHARRRRAGSRRRDPRRRRGQPDPDHGVDGEPGRLRGRPCDGGGREGCAVQGGFDAGGRGSDQEVERRLRLGSMSHPTDGWRGVSCWAVEAAKRVSLAVGK